MKTKKIIKPDKNFAENFIFDLIIDNQTFVEEAIKNCQKYAHMQQVAFSTYHHALTQICFDCLRIRTSISEKELK